MFILKKTSVTYFSFLYFISTVFVNSAEINRYATASEIRPRFLSQNFQQPEIKVVEILFTELAGKEKILAGSGLLVNVKIRKTKPSPNQIRQEKTYQKYEYTVISNEHVVRYLDRNIYFIRFNGKTRPVYDVYTTRESSGYDLSLLKFSSDEYLPNLPFMDFRAPKKDSAKISVNGWVESSGRSTEFKTTGISMIRQGSRYICYGGNRKSKIVEDICDGDNIPPEIKLLEGEEPLTKDGMSGGAVVSSQGELIGIHCHIDYGIPIVVVFRFYTSYKNQYDDNELSPCFRQMTKQCRRSYVEML